MSQAYTASAVAVSSNCIKFSWTGGKFSYDDRAMLLAYDITGEIASFNTASERADGGYALLNVNNKLKADSCFLYLAIKMPPNSV